MTNRTEEKGRRNEKRSTSYKLELKKGAVSKSRVDVRVEALGKVRG
jgi:hypothetical protein